MEFKAVTLAKDALTSRKRQHSKRDESEQRRLIALWQSSGKKQSEFCREHDLNAKTFSNWVRALTVPPKHKDTMISESASSDTQTCLPQGVEIDLPNGICLRFHHGISSYQLSLILQGDY